MSSLVLVTSSPRGADSLSARFATAALLAQAA